MPAKKKLVAVDTGAGKRAIVNLDALAWAEIVPEMPGYPGLSESLRLHFPGGHVDLDAEEAERVLEMLGMTFEDIGIVRA